MRGKREEQMTVKDLKLDTKDDEGGESETQRERKGYQPKTKTAAEKREAKEACSCLQQNSISKGDKKDGTTNYRVVKYGSAERKNRHRDR